ncbi:MAG TPA: trypsin-like peptidase domain-containing protein [bacterium]|nr:trypsin-like peptidase domain-containing protein [bacterium]HPN43623.1 trypsin-like peptidase domain-containing protein [bacterium]
MLENAKKYPGYFLTLLMLGLLFNTLIPVTHSIPNAMAARQKYNYAAGNGNINTFTTVENSRRNAITEAIEKVSPAVVGINITQVQRYYSNNPFFDDPFFRHFFREWPTFEKQVQSLGSGFIFSPEGYILTNQHVVENATEIIVTRVGGKQYKARKIGEDYETDVAVLKIEDDIGFPAAPLGNSDDMIIGEWAIAIGNPFGLFDITSKPTVTVGVISAKDQDFGKQSNDRLFEDMLQTDAAINGGNSGGPLVNCIGEVIGINTWIISGSETRTSSIGLGFAVPINRVKKILDDLMTNGYVERSFWTGVHYDVVSPAVAQYLGLKSTLGAIITDIDKRSPAEKAGLKVGDVILAINGTPVNTADEISNIINNQDLKVGEYLDLKIYRDGNNYNVMVMLATDPKKQKQGYK